jgi:tricarballylate dehydrogenase
MAEMATGRENWSHATRTLAIPDTEVIGNFAEQVPPTIKWLQSVGVKFEFLPTQFLTATQPRLLPVGGGAALVDALAAQAEKLGVTFFYYTTARRLLLNDDGVVTGLFAQQKGTQSVRFHGKVVLACGGFEGDFAGDAGVEERGDFIGRGEGVADDAACADFGSGGTARK